MRQWELYKIYEITGTRLQSVGAEKKFQNRGQALIAAEAEDHGRNIVVHGQEIHFTISGFFNRSTSLDAVNRRLALELEKANPGHCRIISNNSLVDAASLEDLEKLREMSCRPASTDGLHVVIHHRWPITVPAPRGDLTLAYLFWEESKVPQYLIETLNDYDGVLVGADFISTALISSGLTRPISVVGFSPNLDRFVGLYVKNHNKANLKSAIHLFTCLILLQYQRPRLAVTGIRQNIQRNGPGSAHCKGLSKPAQ